MSTATTASTGSTDRADTLHFTPPTGRNYPRILIHGGTILAITVFVMGATWAWQPYYQAELGRIVAGIGVAAGLTVLIGLNGQFSLGHGALMAISGYTVALMQSNLAKNASLYGWRVVISLAVGVLLTMVAGLIVGVAAARLRGPYLAGATLAMALIVPSVAALATKFLNGDQGRRVTLDPRPVAIANMHIGNAYVGSEQWRTWISIAFTVPALILLANLVKSRIGRSWRMIRDDEVAAQLAGVNIARTQIVCFVVSSFCAGISGGLLAILSRVANPGTFGIQLSLYLLLGIVIGGIGSLWGAVWGSILIVALPDYLSAKVQSATNGNALLYNKFNGNLALVLFGLALILVILFAPGGIQGFINRVIAWARRPFQQRASG
jgi:ABC-type branched-subunit amino acid transport system permease subunit